MLFMCCEHIKQGLYEEEACSADKLCLVYIYAKLYLTLKQSLFVHECFEFEAFFMLEPLSSHSLIRIKHSLYNRKEVLRQA